MVGERLENPYDHPIIAASIHTNVLRYGNTEEGMEYRGALTEISSLSGNNLTDPVTFIKALNSCLKKSVCRVQYIL